MSENLSSGWPRGWTSRSQSTSYAPDPLSMGVRISTCVDVVGTTSPLFTYCGKKSSANFLVIQWRQSGSLWPSCCDEVNSADQVCSDGCRLADYNYRHRSRDRSTKRPLPCRVPGVWPWIRCRVCGYHLVLVRHDDNLCFRVLLIFQRQGVYHGQVDYLPPNLCTWKSVSKAFARDPSRKAAFNWLSQKLSVEQVGFPGRPHRRVCPQK